MRFTVSIKKNRHFRQVYGKGRSAANRCLVMYVAKNGTESNRIGISVSKKIGNSVTRNRTKRRIKEAYRTLEPQVARGHDIVIIARNPAAGADYWELMNSLSRLLTRQALTGRGRPADGAGL